ncbi:MAG: hypothetical protein NTY72_14245 [Bacteroidetes bacterium]|nr:hypothetical protein [Bacteroidota bacterium]
MFKKNLALKIIIIAILILFIYKDILPICSAKASEKKWKSIRTGQVATYVVNDFENQNKENDYKNIVLLGKNGARVLGATNLSLSITRNNIWKFRYDFWTIRYNKYSLNIVNKMYTPPYIIYRDTIYCNTNRQFNKQLNIVYLPLK